MVGSDPSWGFSGAIATALGCAPIDLEAPQELLLDPPPAQRYVDTGERCRSIEVRAQPKSVSQSATTMTATIDLF